MTRPLAILLALGALGTAGCKSYTPALLFGGEGLRNDAVLVVPFREPRQKRWYGESARGEFVSESIKYWVHRNWSGMLVDSDVADEAVEKVRDWPGERISLADWQKLCKDTDIDFVVVGDLTEVRLKSRMRIGYLDPYASARYRVIDVAKGREVFVRKKVEVTRESSRREDFKVPFHDMAQDEKKAEKALLAGLARKIGRELYGAYSD